MPSDFVENEYELDPQASSARGRNSIPAICEDMME